MSDYYTFMFILSCILFGMYFISAWKSYYREKEREKTLREAMKR